MAKNFIVTGLACIGLIACASTATGPEAGARFDRFTTVSSDKSLSSFDKVYIAPVAVSEDIAARVGYRTRGPNDHIRPLGERDIAQQSALLADRVTGALAGRFDIVNAPGADVLTIAMTITELDANRPTLAELNDEPGLSVNSLSTGGATVMIEFSSDGVVLAKATDSNYKEQNIDQITGGIWGEARRMYDRLGRKVSDLLS